MANRIDCIGLDGGKSDTRTCSGSVCIFVTPQSILRTSFGRAFFFLLDKSASMEGKPYQEATQALHIALEQLRPLDQFNVCVFDHKHLCYQPTLVPANKDKISECKSWMEKHEPQNPQIIPTSTGR
eukprot:1057796_1